jgi:hypothetical protein
MHVLRRNIQIIDALALILAGGFFTDLEYLIQFDELPLAKKP